MILFLAFVLSGMGSESYRVRECSTGVMTWLVFTLERPSLLKGGLASGDLETRRRCERIQNKYWHVYPTLVDYYPRYTHLPVDDPDLTSAPAYLADGSWESEGWAEFQDRSFRMVTARYAYHLMRQGRTRREVRWMLDVALLEEWRRKLFPAPARPDEYHG